MAVSEGLDGNRDNRSRSPGSAEAAYFKAESMAEAFGENLFRLQQGLATLDEAPGRSVEDLRKYHSAAVEAAVALQLALRQAGERLGFDQPPVNLEDDTTTEIAAVRTAMLGDIRKRMGLIGDLAAAMPTHHEADLPVGLEELVRSLDTDVVMYQAVPHLDVFGTDRD